MGANEVARPHATGVTAEGRLYFQLRPGESPEAWIHRIRDGLRGAVEERRREHSEDATDYSVLPGTAEWWLRALE